MLCFGAAVGIKQLWWQLKWAMGVFRGGAASGEGRAVLELQPLRLKASPLAGGDEALADKRTGGSSSRFEVMEPSLRLGAGRQGGVEAAV